VCVCVGVFRYFRLLFYLRKIKGPILKCPKTKIGEFKKSFLLIFLLTYMASPRSDHVDFLK